MTPWTVGSSVHEILQARILKRAAATPSSRGSFQPRESNLSLWCLQHWQTGSLSLAPPGKFSHLGLTLLLKKGLNVSRQRRQWHPTPVLLPGKSHGRRSLVGCSSWGLEESDTTERLHFHFSLSCIGEGTGTPLQCSCLENPRDGETGGLPSLGSHRVGHDWSDLAAAMWADDTTLMAESEEELNSLQMKVKEESEKIGFKLNIQKTKIMAS